MTFCLHQSLSTGIAVGNGHVSPGHVPLPCERPGTSPSGDLLIQINDRLGKCGSFCILLRMDVIGYLQEMPGRMGNLLYTRQCSCGCIDWPQPPSSTVLSLRSTHSLDMLTFRPTGSLVQMQPCPTFNLQEKGQPRQSIIYTFHTSISQRKLRSPLPAAAKTLHTTAAQLKPNTHRRRRRDETVLSRRVGVGGVYMNLQLVHDDCRRIRPCERSRRP